MRTSVLALAAVAAAMLLAAPGGSADVPTVYAQATQWYEADLPPTVDAAPAGVAVTGWRGFSGYMYGTATIGDASVSLDAVDPSLQFEPPVSLPQTVTKPSLAPYETFGLNTLTGWGGSKIDGVSFDPGVGVARTVQVTPNPDGTSTAHVQVAVSATPAWAARPGYVSVSLWTSAPGAVFDVSSVVAPAAGGVSQRDTYAVGWWLAPPAGPSSGSVDIVLPATFADPASFKPRVWVSLVSAVSDGAVDGTSASITDGDLGGTWTFSTGTPVHWATGHGTTYTLQLEEAVPPPPPPVSASVYESATADVPATEESVSAFHAYDGTWTWSAQMQNLGTADLASPAISLDGVDARWTQPVRPLPPFPISESAPTFYAGSDFPYDPRYPSDLPLGWFGYHGPVMPGQDVTWKLLSPASDTVPPGGSTQRWALTVTLRNPSFANGQVMVQLEPQWNLGRATVVPGSVVAPSLGEGETLVGLDTTGGRLWWSAARAVLDKPYTVTFDLAVPNGGALPVSFRPGAWTDASAVMHSWNGGDGASSTVPIAYLGGTFTFTVGTPVRWSLGTGQSVGVSLAVRGPTVLGGRAALADAAAAAAALSPAAGADLAAAGADELWLDADHLVPARGARMFQLSKSAVLELGRPPQRLGAPRDAVSVVAEIVALDRKLATSAIAEAAAQDGVPQLDTARSQLAAGDAARAADTPDALDHYKNAWNAAEQAVRG